MKLSMSSWKNAGKVTMAMVMALSLASCSEEDDMMDDEPMTMSYNY